MMGFYDLSKDQRTKLADKIEQQIKHDLENQNHDNFKKYASDSDTYIRKTAYIAIGKLYRKEKGLNSRILALLKELSEDPNEKIRQTMVYALGEIGKIDFPVISDLFEARLNDVHHSVRNGVIGALKQIGQKNPDSALEFAKKYLHHPDPKIRGEMIHGIELRGRTHPEDVLPILKEMQFEPNPKVRKMIIHVLGQISYKKGCLEKVISHFKNWENKDLIEKAIQEILQVHQEYARFSDQSYEEAKAYIMGEFQVHS